MFATLFGGLPRPPFEASEPPDVLVEAAVRAQEDAGLEPVSDGGLRPGFASVDGWLATANLTTHAVKQSIVGPYTAVRRPGGTNEAALDHANELNRLVRDLAAAGCPMIEIHEPAAVHIDTDEERRRFRELHERLLDGVAGTHLSLVITDGNADRAGIDTLLAAPYSSLGVDLIAGPDNWRLIVEATGTIGIICGALSPSADSLDGPETLLWAAGYAASTGGRGANRVGLATASSLAHLSWDQAIAKIDRLGEAARLAASPLDVRVRAMDPRAVSSRAAALGTVETRPSEPRDDPTDAT
jgi:methionine synthase II (cobalamin-independent)